LRRLIRIDRHFDRSQRCAQSDADAFEEGLLRSPALEERVRPLILWQRIKCPSLAVGHQIFDQVPGGPCTPERLDIDTERKLPCEGGQNPVAGMTHIEMHAATRRQYADIKLRFAAPIRIDAHPCRRHFQVLAEDAARGDAGDLEPAPVFIPDEAGRACLFRGGQEITELARWCRMHFERNSPDMRLIPGRGSRRPRRGRLEWSPWMCLVS
jgi:hypothetical protein